MFGLTAESLKEQLVIHSCQLTINAGDIIYITGPSGAGKSVLLSELEKQIPVTERINLSEIRLEDNKALIDCIDGELLGSLRHLSTAGLNDCMCLLNSPVNLSAGQQWRYRLAMALASKAEYIFADEFCTNLDRITAAVISYNIRKFAKRNNVTFVLASSSEDILSDLLPDVLVMKDFSGPAEVIYKQSNRKKNN